ncbi:MAG: glycosyltransferase family 2 protein [Pseudomonadota bacterium]
MTGLMDSAGCHQAGSSVDISVVTPSFNQGQFIEQTIRSVLGQEGVNLQYIVVDALSSDRTPEVLTRYEHLIDVLIAEKDSGQADALCKGFSHARGKFCCFVNSDDVLFPGALARAVDYLKNNPGVDAVYSHRVFIDEHGRLLKFWILPGHSDYFMSRWDYIPQESCVWRTDTMISIGGIDPSYHFAMDYDFFVRMMNRGTMVRLNTFLAAFRVHGRSKTSCLLSTTGLREMNLVREKYGIRLTASDRLASAMLYAGIESASWFYQRVLARGKPGFLELKLLQSSRSDQK